jgi:hypothetical protein
VRRPASDEGREGARGYGGRRAGGPRLNCVRFVDGRRTVEMVGPRI